MFLPLLPEEGDASGSNSAYTEPSRLREDRGQIPNVSEVLGLSEKIVRTERILSHL